MNHASHTYIEALSFAAPSLPDWSTTQAALRGEHEYVANELPLYQPTLLPANERRRASAIVRIAFRVAEAATQCSSISASNLASVFSSSDGDLNIAQRICSALANTPRLISPTDFHNSVHNAAAGYWSIASSAKGPATAIAAYDHGFAMGLLEAQGMVQIEHQSTLLVVYDVPAPSPMLAKRTVLHPVGVAMILTREPTANTLASITMQSLDATDTCFNNVALEQLRLSNPAARALPLLQLLANGCGGIVNLALPHGRALQVTLHTVNSSKATAT